MTVSRASVDQVRGASFRFDDAGERAVGRHGVATAALDGSVYVLGGALVPTHAKATDVVSALDLPPT